ncbi:MAG TPA: GyrI-like domain-containing protein [Fimbriimonas sp.]|nr:GyrI-like domain-containing protein [Fimbriimonas sp.]
MNVDFVNQNEITVAMIKHTGPFEQLAGEFDRLWQWVTENNVPVQRTIGIYWDNPEEVPASKLRSAACVEIPAGYMITNTAGLPIEKGHIAPGLYARYRYMGPYEEMEPVWTEFLSWVQDDCGKTISENPSFEVYVNDPSDTPPAQLLTEMFLPVE